MNMANDHIYTRNALIENVRRFEQIVSCNTKAGTTNHKWMQTFYRGMEHIINVIHLADNGKLTDEDVIRSLSRRYHPEEFIDECAAKIMEFTAMVDKHYDSVVRDDVKMYDSEQLPVCTSKMIDYVGQNLIRRIMYIAAKPEIDEFVIQHPDMSPYPTISENTPAMFMLRSLLSSVYVAIVRLHRERPVARQAMLKAFVQQVITVVPFWSVVDLLPYPFTRNKQPVQEQDQDVILSNDVACKDAESEQTESESKNETVVDQSTQVPDDAPVDVVPLLETSPKATVRHQLPEHLMKYNLRKLIGERLRAQKQQFMHPESTTESVVDNGSA
jgi:hypothetical protein